jgi:hypothetical protein
MKVKKQEQAAKRHSQRQQLENIADYAGYGSDLL